MPLTANLAAAQTIGARQRPTKPGPLGDDRVASFQIKSASGGLAKPFTAGQAFPQGAVGNPSFLGADTPVQVMPRHYWPDGSLKYALIVGRKTLSAGVPATVTLTTAGAVTSTANLSITNLKATGITAAVAYDVFGAATWSGTDWDTPVEAEMIGPELSIWTYSKTMATGLAAWLEVRLYAGGQVQVLPWIENGSGLRNGTATFTLGGTQRFSGEVMLPMNRREPLVSGTTLSHWLGADPAVTVTHDAAYLHHTRLQYVPAIEMLVWFDNGLSGNLVLRET